MKTTILILALFFFSFSLESSAPSEDVTLEQPAEAITVTIYHNLGNGQYIEIEVPIQAVPGHLLHGDTLNDPTGCEPPDC